jgi:hypothetical protein
LDDIEFSIIKSRNNVGTSGWNVWHKGLSSLTHYLSLDSSAGESNGGSNFSGIWGSVIGLNATMMTNGAQLVSFNFASVDGLCDVFTYKGTGVADGPNVVCGFKPRWILLKQTNASRSWLIYDCERNEFNPVNSGLYADLNNAESSSSTRDIDILANGFKIRGTASTHNASGGTYIGIAIADVAGGGNLPAILGN